MKYRILVVCDYSALYSGNFIKSLLKLREELVSTQIKLLFAFPIQSKNREWIKQLDKDEVCFIDLNGKKYSTIIEIGKLISNWKPTIVHAHFCSPNYFKPYTIIFPSIRFIIHDHSDFSSGSTSIKKKMKDCFTYKFLTRNMLFACVSGEFLKKNTNHAVHIPNGIVVHESISTESNRCEFRTRLNIAKQDILCEIFGWSPYVKGVDIAIEAIKIANMKGDYQFKLAIVYGKNTGKENIQEYIRNNTSCTGKEDFLLYLPPTENVFEYHEACDIHISASRSEGFSYSILEMLSIGKRCVISDIPGTRWAQKYESVQVFKTENPISCSDALIEVVKKDPYIKSVEDEVRKDYSIDKWIKDILRIYGVINA